MATTKHKKAAIDAKRGKLFAKLIKNIEIAARMGGGDPDGNPSLYDAIYKAKKAPCRPTTSSAPSSVVPVRKPAAPTMKTSCTRVTPRQVLADHRMPHRQPQPCGRDVRSTLTKGNGSLATTGSVSFNFERKGQIVVPAEGVDFDNLFEKAAEAGAEDVTDDGEVFTVITDPSDMIDVRKALQDAGFDYDSADLVMMPKNEVELSLEDARRSPSSSTTSMIWTMSRTSTPTGPPPTRSWPSLTRSIQRDYSWRRPRADSLRGRRD